MGRKRDEDVDVEGDASAGAGSVGVAAGASTVSRDDLQNIFESFKNSLDTRLSQIEQVVDIGGPESQTRGIVKDSHEWSANAKRTYDEYQDLALSQARDHQQWASRSRDHYDAMMSDARVHIENKRKIELELLQNGNTAAKIGDNAMWTTDKELIEAVAAVVAAKVIDTKDQTSD